MISSILYFFDDNKQIKSEEENQNKNEEIISNMKSSIITNSQGKENEIRGKKFYYY